MMAQAAAAQLLHLAARVLELPVHVVQLDLAELQEIAVRLQEAHERLVVSMHREAQVLDATGAHLLGEERHGAVLLIVQVLLDVQLAHVVQQVEVEVVDSASLELLGEDPLVLSEVRNVVARELVGKVERIARVAGQRPPEDALGVAAVIAPGGVIVVDAVLVGVVDHLEGRCLVDGRVVAIDDRQAHGTEPEGGELEVLEVVVLHGDPFSARTQCSALSRFGSLIGLMPCSPSRCT